MQAAGRAMALDPESQAAALVTSLVVEPPRELPPALEAELDRVDLDELIAGAANAWKAMLAAFLLLPLIIWNGVKRPEVVIVAFGFAALAGVHAWLQQRYRTRSMAFPVVVLVSISA